MKSGIAALTLGAAGDGWRIRGRLPRIRWSYGDESSYDATARQAAWLRES